VTDSLGAQLSAADAAVAKQLAVKLTQVHSTKFLDRNIAKVRLHLVHYQLREPLPGLR